MKKIILSLFTFTLFLGTAQPIFFPDAVFKQALVDNTNINTNFDNEIDMSEAASFSGGLGLAGYAIHDFTGLHEFINIVAFDCGGNTNVSSLDFSNNYNLLSISCAGCSSLTSLITGGNFQLTTIVAPNCNISTLTLPQNNVVTYLDLSNNNLSGIAAQNYPSLETFNVSNNPLENGSVYVNAGIDPTVFDLSNTDFTSVDFSTFVNLKRLKMTDCSGLTSLNVANGNNTSMLNTEFDIRNNPNLTCVEVDAAAYSTTNWTLVDATTSFSEDCSSVNTNSVGEGIEMSINLLPNPTTGIVNLETTAQIELIEVYNLIGEKVNVSSNTNTINIEELPNGIYVVKVTTNERVSVTKKLVKK